MGKRTDDNFNHEENENVSDDVEIKNKKERRKSDRQKGKRYIKAKYMYHVGYIFKAIKNYIKYNLLYYLKQFIKPIMAIILIISVILFIWSAVKVANGLSLNDDINKQNQINKKLISKNNDLKSKTNSQNRKIDKVQISNQTGVKRAKKVIDRVFKGMFDYEDVDEYEENRKSNLENFDDPKAKWIDKIYSDGKDDNGDNQIETLGLTSELNNIDIFTDSPDDTKKKVIPFKVIVSYTGYIDGLSSDNATRTHYSTYEIDFNTKNNKIEEMKKVNTVKVNNSIN